MAAQALILERPTHNPQNVYIAFAVNASCESDVDQGGVPADGQNLLVALA